MSPALRKLLESKSKEEIITLFDGMGAMLTAADELVMKALGIDLVLTLKKHHNPQLCRPDCPILTTITFMESLHTLNPNFPSSPVKE